MCLCEANEYFRVEIDVISGGCRTRTLSFIHGPSIFVNCCIYTIIEKKRNWPTRGPLCSTHFISLSHRVFRRSEQQQARVNSTQWAAGASLVRLGVRHTQVARARCQDMWRRAWRHVFWHRGISNVGFFFYARSSTSASRSVAPRRVTSTPGLMTPTSTVQRWV